MAKGATRAQPSARSRSSEAPAWRQAEMLFVDNFPLAEVRRPVRAEESNAAKPDSGAEESPDMESAVRRLIALLSEEKG